MSSRTVYTSTVRVPIYAGWRCEKCGEKNFSAGTITYAVETSSSSWRNAKQNEAKESASRAAQSGWKYHAYQIATDPRQNAMSIRNDFRLQSTTCTNCRAKPQWDRGTLYRLWGVIGTVVAIFSVIAVLTDVRSLAAWLVLICSLSAVGYGFFEENRYKKMMKNLPKEYTPVIGSLNQDLIEYVQKYGKSIPTPNEVIEILDGYQIHNAEDKKALNIQKNSCCKCGAPLQGDARFCHKCGTEIKK